MIDKLANALLEVLDAPLEIRVIVNTCYPCIGGLEDNAYWMIDRSNTEEVYESWWMLDSLGQAATMATSAEVLDFFRKMEGAIVSIHTESH